MVVGHSWGRVATMDEEEAQRWHGRYAVFSSDSMIFARDTCRTPEYHDRMVQADSLLYYSYRSSLKETGFIPNPDGTFRITEVCCGSRHGKEVLWLGNDAIVLAFDGVLFHLVRHP